jgi:hypothetical protein
MVGDVARGEFVAVPAIAVAVIAALREGRTLGETAEQVREQAGGDVDVADFAETLLGLGFVARVDAVPVPGQGPEFGYGGRAGAAAARQARPLYSAPAWTVYCVLFACCIALLSAVPAIRPHYQQLFFLPNPVLSVAVLTVAGVPLAMAHELAHWLGARVQGVPARITISRRYYLAVLQTDLSALWSLPRQRRFAPLLAGMAFDTVVLSVVLGARLTGLTGLWHLPPLASRVLAALALWQVTGISAQFVVFLRTDLYAVLVTGLGCLSLTRTSKLRMARRYRRLSRAEEQELAAAGPQDMAAARWYGWIQVGGAAIAAFYFIAFFTPAVVSMVHWVITGLAKTPPTTPAFWDFLVSGLIALAPVTIPPIIYLHERRAHSRA